jgi:hypothetical protein
VGYTSYLNASHSKHIIVYCGSTDENHLVVCESHRSVSSAIFPANHLEDFCLTRSKLESILTQKDAYSMGLLSDGESGCRPSYASRWHDDHWDYSVTVRI